MVNLQELLYSFQTSCEEHVLLLTSIILFLFLDDLLKPFLNLSSLFHRLVLHTLFGNS